MTREPRPEPTWEYVERLREENAELIERVRQLQELISLPEVVPSGVRLPRLGAIVLGVIFRRNGIVSKESLMAVANDGLWRKDMNEKHLFVVIGQLRTVLKQHGITIENSFREGWSMTPENKARLTAIGYTTR